MRKWLLITLLVLTVRVNAATVYVSQSGGAFSGGSACNGQTAVSVATFNSSQTAGNIYILCGTITSQLTVVNSGTSGNVITLRFDTGANLTSTAWGTTGAINLSSQSFILIDGGTICGYVNNVDVTCNGTITNTANGTSGDTGCTNGSCNQQINSIGIYGNVVHDIEVKNLNITNIYVRTSNSSDTTSGSSSAAVYFPQAGNNMSVHNNITSHAHSLIQMYTNSTVTGWTIYQNRTYEATWHISPTTNANSSSITGMLIYQNDIDSADRWQDPPDAFHHDGIFPYNAGGSGKVITNTQIYGNYFHGNWMSNTTAFIYLSNDPGDTYSNTYVFNNVFDGTGTVALADAPLYMGAATSNVYVYNNSFLGSSGTTGGTAVMTVTSTTGLSLQNNIIQNFQGALYAPTSTTLGTWSNNTYYNVTGTGVCNAWDLNGSCPNTLAAWQTACSCDSASQTANPNLNVNYVPNTGSAVISAGANLTSVGIAALNSDKNGRARPSGVTAWDAGANQYASCTKPVITSPTGVSDATGTQLTITWTTSVPADTSVQASLYNQGTCISNSCVTPLDPAGVTSHTVVIPNLYPSQQYSWGIRSQAIVGGAACGVGYMTMYGAPASVPSTIMSAPPAGPFNYDLTLNGGNYATQGYQFGLTAKVFPLVGTYASNSLKLTVTGLPPFSSVVWPDASTATGGYWAVSANVASTTTVARDTITMSDLTGNGNEMLIQTNVGGTTPPGAYTLTVTASQANSSGYPTLAKTWTMNVVSTTAPFNGVAFPYGTPTSYPAIPDLAMYSASADTYGQQNCAQDEQPGFRTIRANNSTSAAISTVSRTSNVTTVTTVSNLPTGALGINNNNLVQIAGVTDTTFNTAGAVTITVTGANTFTYPNTGTNGTSTGGTVTNTLTPVATCCTYQSWFYDGVLVYYNVENLLNNGRNWSQCRTNVKQVYRDGYILPGSSQVFMQFTKGYYLDYPITGDTADQTLITKLSAPVFAPYHGTFWNVGYLQREVAYTMRNSMHASLMGLGSNFGNLTQTQFRDYSRDRILSQIDQMCLSQNAAYYEDFMMGLQAMELIDYYQIVSPDPRIPPAIKCLADWMWTNRWQAVDVYTFPYDKYESNFGFSVANGGTSCLTTLNNMISPMYAWLFMMTGNTTYQTEGDTIWDHGVRFDCPGTLPQGPSPYMTYPADSDGKTYSQNYSWGTDYIRFRSNPTPGGGPGKTNGKNYGTVGSNGRTYPATPGSNGRVYQ
jgi:hypothetical protein